MVCIFPNIYHFVPFLLYDYIVTVVSHHLFLPPPHPVGENKAETESSRQFRTEKEETSGRGAQFLNGFSVKLAVPLDFQMFW